MDERDRRLLDALSHNAWLTLDELGEIASLSASAVQRRLAKLKKSGALQGANARIAPGALGKPLRIFVLAELHEDKSAQIARLSDTLDAHPDVIEMHYVAGASDLVIVLQIADMAAYAAFAERYLDGADMVRKYATLTVLRTLGR